jgi:DNA-binding PadR family transcriptional regulator
MIDLAILGLLKEQDLHGYELRRRIGELSGSRLTISFGSLYPALNRLEKAGLVKAVTHETVPLPQVPMSGSLQGELAAFRARRRATAKPRRDSRGKKVYGLTNAGEERLHELLVAAEVSDDRDFALRLTFCHNLAPAERLALFEHQRDELVRRREHNRGSNGPAAPTGRVNRYLRALLERDTETLNADLAWLDRLIADERHAVDGAGGHGGPRDATGGTPTGSDTGGQR